MQEALASLEHNTTPSTTTTSEVSLPMDGNTVLVSQAGDIYSPSSPPALMHFTIVPPHSPTTGLLSPGNRVSGLFYYDILNSGLSFSFLLLYFKG